MPVSELMYAMVIGAGDAATGVCEVAASASGRPATIAARTVPARRYPRVRCRVGVTVSRDPERSVHTPLLVVAPGCIEYLPPRTLADPLVNRL